MDDRGVLVCLHKEYHEQSYAGAGGLFRWPSSG
jgi:hypothetical protein